MHVRCPDRTLSHVGMENKALSMELVSPPQSLLGVKFVTGAQVWNICRRKKYACF